MSDTSNTVRGTFVTEIDGVQFYTDGIKHSGTSFSASIAYIDASYDYDGITDEGVWQLGASSRFPIANIDSDGNVRVGADLKAFDIGVVRYADGTQGAYGGLSLGGPLAGFSVSLHGGGDRSGPHGNFSTYDHIEVYLDGSYAKVEYSPASGTTSDGDPVTGAKVTRTTYNPDGTLRGEPIVGSVTPQYAREMASGDAPKIHESSSYWGPDECFSAGTLVSTAAGSVLIEAVRPGMSVLCFDGAADGGRGALVARPVVRVYENTTDCFIRLDYPDAREPLVVTPGHPFLDVTGGFTQIGQMLRLGGDRAQVVDADGSVVTVTGT